jgi:hypothetical protein
MPVRWHCEDFYFETEPDPRAARGQDADGRAVRQHDGRQEFWTGKTWIFIPAEAKITKVLEDGLYVDRGDGLPYRRKGTLWYYWSRSHLDWKWCEGMSDDSSSTDNMMKIGTLNG